MNPQQLRDKGDEYRRHYYELAEKLEKVQTMFPVGMTVKLPSTKAVIVATTSIPAYAADRFCGVVGKVTGHVAHQGEGGVEVRVQAETGQGFTEPSVYCQPEHLLHG